MNRDEFQFIVDEFTGEENTSVISEIWCVGGVGGGNCWTDDGHYDLAADPEPDLEVLDKILERAAPNITYLQYKKLSKMIKTEDYSQNEYYGNYTNYRKKYISVDDIWNMIMEIDVYATNE